MRRWRTRGRPAVGLENRPWLTESAVVTESRLGGGHSAAPATAGGMAQIADLRASAVKVTEGGERRVYTRQLRTVHVALILFISMVVAVGPTGEFVIGNHALAATIAGVTYAAGLLSSVAVFLRAIVVTPGLVTLRGLCTTRHIPAWEVARFEPPRPHGKVFGRVALRVVLVDGRVRYVGCFTNTQVDAGDVGVEECKELNRWLALHTGNPAPGALPDRRSDRRWRTVAWVSWLVLVAAFALVSLLVVLSTMTDPSFGA
jgi:hypothetical protein